MEPTETESVSTETKETKSEETQSTSSSKHKSKLNEIDNVEELREIARNAQKDAYKYRTERNTLRIKVDEIDAKERKTQEDELKKKGEYEKLIEEKDKKIAEYEPIVNAYKQDQQEQRDKIKSELGDDYLEEFDNLSLTGLRKITEKLGKTTTKIEVDDPLKNKKETVKVELTEDDKKEAEIMFPNFTEQEAYEAYKEIKIRKIELKKGKNNG